MFGSQIEWYTVPCHGAALVVICMRVNDDCIERNEGHYHALRWTFDHTYPANSISVFIHSSILTPILIVSQWPHSMLVQYSYTYCCYLLWYCTCSVHTVAMSLSDITPMCTIQVIALWVCMVTSTCEWNLIANHTIYVLIISSIKFLIL